MKKLIILIFLVLAGCLFPGSPHSDWYVPTEFTAKEIQKRNGSVLYKLILIDLVKFYSSIRVESFPGDKELLLDVKLVNNTLKPVVFYADSLKLISDRLVFDLKHEPGNNHVVSIKPDDSLSIKYSQLLLVNDRKWYGKIKKYDTLILKVLIDESYYSIPFYFNKKDGLETYPFERDW